MSAVHVMDGCEMVEHWHYAHRPYPAPSGLHVLCQVSQFVHVSLPIFCDAIQFSWIEMSRMSPLPEALL